MIKSKIKIKINKTKKSNRNVKNCKESERFPCLQTDLLAGHRTTDTN